MVIQVSTEVIPRSGIDLTALLSQQISEIATLINSNKNYDNNDF